MAVRKLREEETDEYFSIHLSGRIEEVFKRSFSKEGGGIAKAAKMFKRRPPGFEEHGFI